MKKNISKMPCILFYTYAKIVLIEYHRKRWNICLVEVNYER